MEIIVETAKTNRKSIILSWLAVLMLGTVIFGILYGASEMLGRHLGDWFFECVFQWNSNRLIFSAAVTLALVVLLAAFLAYGLERKMVEKRTVLILGSWVLYLPGFAGGLFAAAGLSYLMVFPFVAGGLMSAVPMLLAEHGLLPTRWGDWVIYGRVGRGAIDRADGGAWHLWALLIVAMGLAITILGFIQVVRAHRQKKLQIEGLYSTIRHPQHLGIAIWTLGLAFAASTTAAYLTWFTVLFFYVLLALWEEQRLASQSGEAYEAYREATPFMVPFFKVGLPLPKSPGPKVASLAAYCIAGMAVLCVVMQIIGVDTGHYL